MNKTIVSEHERNGTERSSPPKPAPFGDRYSGVDGLRKSYRDVLDPVHVDHNPSFTQEAVRTLLADIHELAKEEEAIFAKLDLKRDLPSDAKLPDLERAAVDLSRIDERIVAKTSQLPDPTEIDQYLTAETDLDEYTQRLVRRDPSVWKDRLLLSELRARIASRVTRDRARRPRARRPRPDPQSGGTSAHPEPSTNDEPSNIYSRTPIEHHDVLVVAPEGVHSGEELYRFPVTTTASNNPTALASNTTRAVRGPGVAVEERVGQYRDKPELHDAFDDGQRRTLSVIRPQDWGPASVRGTQRGPAFATLPIKPEPEPAAGVDSSQCYLINTRNLNFRNAWTAEEWNDTPGGVDLPPAQGAMMNEVEALLAGPQGKVFRLVLTHVADWKRGMTARIIATSSNDAGEVQQRELGAIESVNLGSHMEVWHQLRGGTAMGRVYFDDASGPRVIPLVNITTLTRD